MEEERVATTNRNTLWSAPFRKLIGSYRLLLSPRYRTLTVSIILIVLFLGIVAAFEFKTSRLQARYLSARAQSLTYTVHPRPSKRIRFPSEGPYDERLGYTLFPKFISKLTASGFSITNQAELSEQHAAIIDQGIFPIYRSKSRTGLTILEKDGEVLFQDMRPSVLFESFEAIPRQILEPLLFIENREVLDDSVPFKNPAVEWDRLLRAVFEKISTEFTTRARSPGGSTIATQMEKYRHSTEGRTHSVFDKWRQMYSASLRAYLNGPNTNQARRETVLDYINSIPLAAYPGYGEVYGLGDGLKIWFGTDLGDVQRALQSNEPTLLHRQAIYFKQALSLFIAHRRPSFFLVSGKKELRSLTDEYIRIVFKHGLISKALYDAALPAELKFNSGMYVPTQESFLRLKTANSVRNWLVNELDLSGMYQLNQLDIDVQSSLASKVSQQITQTLISLGDAKVAKERGLLADRLLQRGDPKAVNYSVMLFERTPGRNLLRVQTDNLNQPLDLNEGGRMDLGSTAKLRTLVSYLEAVEAAYKEWQSTLPTERPALATRHRDFISQTVYGHLKLHNEASLQDVLGVALDREYSSSPGEAFFTGGGLHHFENFRKEDNGRTVTVATAFKESINLPFVRIMRDVVRFYGTRTASSQYAKNVTDDELRIEYVKRFAVHEGGQFLRNFFGTYKGKSNTRELLLQKVKKTQSRYAAVFLFFEPRANVERLQAFLKRKGFSPSEKELVTLRERYAGSTSDKFDLNDWGYIAGVHPLELWLARYLERSPAASQKEVLKQSKDACIESYHWLMKPTKRGAQEKRIRVLLESDAFDAIFASWKRQGYPFNSMVPSYASALGSSGDRPAALAELVGILLNEGVRQPSIRVESVRLGKNTPYDTELKNNKSIPERVLSKEVAAAAREAMRTVVEQGTARRVFGVFKDATGVPYVMGGKTGTGDHRFKTFAKGGGLKSSRVVSRAATFTFYIGDRFFGVVSAHVRGAEAAKFEFTSALAAEVLKAIAPEISPLLQ